MKAVIVNLMVIGLVLSAVSMVQGQMVSKVLLFEQHSCPKIDTIPSFPGGDKALNKYFHSQLKQAAKQVGENIFTLSSYEAYVKVLLDQTGKVILFNIIKSTPSFSIMDEKVKQTLKAMPQWSPCIIGSKAVPQSVGLIIKYNTNISQLEFD